MCGGFFTTSCQKYIYISGKLIRLQYLYMYECVCVHAYVYVCLCMYVCLFPCVYPSTLSMYMSICLYINLMYICLFIYLVFTCDRILLINIRKCLFTLSVNKHLNLFHYSFRDGTLCRRAMGRQIDIYESAALLIVSISTPQLVYQKS